MKTVKVPISEELDLSSRTRLKYERVVRYTHLGLKDEEIATILGYKTPVTIRVMRTSQEYKVLDAAYQANVLSVFDEALSEDTIGLQHVVRAKVPQALKKLFDVLESKNDKLSFEAAKELIAMDGRVAKVQRLGLPSEAQGGIGDSESLIADAIVSSVKKKSS